jgi:hypothetical protein
MAGIAAPSSARTSPSQTASTAPAIQPTIACGPENVATISGIVMNGPIPTICVMLIAVAESRPIERWNVWRLAWLAASCGSR